MTAGRSSGARAPASISTGFQCAVQKLLPHSFRTEQVHLHHCIPSMCGTQWSIFLICHKSCAHSFKTEQVHLHHCIPLRWGCNGQSFLNTTYQIVTQSKQSGCTCTTAYPRCAGHNGQFSFRPKKTDNFVGGMQWCRCTRPVFNLCDNLICSSGKIDHQKWTIVPDLRGMQWCRCTRPVSKLCAHGIKHFVLHIEGCGGAGAPALSPYKKNKSNHKTFALS